MATTRTPIDAQTDPKPGDIVAGREVYLRAGDRLIREVLAIGAAAGCPVSCDGTSATLYATTAPALGQAATGAPQMLLGLT